ncbi:hypothetical protein Q0M94_28395 (plasmid) [Deinococcus radiomollis]|uniref:hypothetical protein n=1 Tax=Deinococcus radiomollis TaxID=468916 RepID=UPI0038918E3C
MSAAKRPKLKDSRRQFWWGEHDLIDYGIPARVGTSAWAVYTALLRHLSDENGAFPSIQLLEAEIGVSNRVIANSLKTLSTVGLISIDREAHQWNVYYILDCTHAIKKNGWARVKPKARDDSSPAPKRTPGRPKHVTKTTGARDDSSPEHVTNRHTKNNQLITTKEESGGHSFTETAREEAQPENPAAPVAVIDLPVPTTTEDASLLKASVGDAADGPKVAGAPDGANGEGLELTDEDMSMLFGSSDENAEDLEQVPGAAAAGRAALSSLVSTLPAPASQELPTPGAVDLLWAIPEAELLGRPAATPADANYKTIVGMVGGKRVIEDGILEGHTPSGGVPRGYWLRLTSMELASIREAAQGEAKATSTSFLTLCILGLDRMIGAPKRTQKAVPVMNGNAAKVTQPGQKLTTPPEEPATGSSLLGAWELKSNPEITLEVVSADVGTVTLSDGATMRTADLIVRHNRLLA